MQIGKQPEGRSDTEEQRAAEGTKEITEEQWAQQNTGHRVSGKLRP